MSIKLYIFDLKRIIVFLTTLLCFVLLGCSSHQPPSVEQKAEPATAGDVQPDLDLTLIPHPATSPPMDFFQSGQNRQVEETVASMLSQPEITQIPETWRAAYADMIVNDGTAEEETICQNGWAPIREEYTLEMNLDHIRSEIPRYYEIVICYQDFISHRDIEMEEALGVLFERIADNLSIGKDIYQYDDAYRLWCSCVEARNSNVSYAFYDINNDGTPELIILSDDFSIHAIYTLCDDSSVLVGAFWPRYRCVIDGTGTLYIHSSGGAYDSSSASYVLKPNCAELQLFEMVGMESYDAQVGEILPEPRCFQIQKGTKTIISYEEACVLWEKFPDASPANSIATSVLMLNDPLIQ